MKPNRRDMIRPASARSLGGDSDELQTSQVVGGDDPLASNRFSLDDDDSVLSMPAAT